MSGCKACLGVGAKEGERNVVQLTVEDKNGAVQNSVILSLKLGLLEQVRVHVGGADSETSGVWLE